MNVYALSGRGNTGKSTTLANLFVQIMEYYGTRANIVYINNNLTAATVKAQIEQERKLRRLGQYCSASNLETVIEIDNYLIAINTSGDYEGAVIRSEDLFNGKESCGRACDLGFCAIRSKGATIERIRVLSRNTSNNVTIMEKAYIANASRFAKYHDYLDSLNDWQTELLMDIVKSLVN